MKKDRILKLLPLIGAVHSPGMRAKWVIAHCPFARVTHVKGSDSNPSFGIKVNDKGRSGYNCFSCGQRGWLMDLIPRLSKLIPKDQRSKGTNYKQAYAMVLGHEIEEQIGGQEDYEVDSVYYKKKDDFPFDETWLHSFAHIHLFSEALNYVFGRGLQEWQVEDYGLRYDTSLKRVCFPVWNMKKQLVGLHGRLIDKTIDAPPYWMYPYKNQTNPLAWYGEHWLDFTKPVLLVESVFDLARVHRLYDNVACSLTAGIGPDKVKRIAKGDRYVTLYDTGTGGDAARAALTKYMRGVSLKHLKLPKGRKDPGETPLNELEDILGPYLDLHHYNS